MKTPALILTMSLFFAGALFAQVDLESDLVLYFTFDEIADATVPDASASGIPGTIIGPSYSLTEGWIGNALDLNPNEGDATYVDVITDPVFDITDQITLSVWVYARDDGNDQDNPWLIKGDHGYGIKHRGLHSDTNMNEFEFFIYNSGWYTVKAPADPVYNEFWHHFAGTFDGLTQILYIDGEPVTASEEYVGTIGTTEYAVNIGRNSEKTDRIYNGIIDEARIYSRALTPEEIMALYTLPTRIHEANNFPKEFVLNQNFPNPFNPVTHISYSLPKTGYVTLKVVDLQGRETATLVDQFQNGGQYTVGFDASGLASGIYFYRLQAGNQILMRKMILLR